MSSNFKQRIVVLGAAGFIGYHLSRKLSEMKNIDLILFDNFVRSTRDKEFKLLLLKKNVKFINADLTLPASFSDCFQKGDIVINCVAYNGTQNFYRSPADVIKHSAIPAILAPEFAAKAGVFRYFYFGSAESYAGGVNLGIIKVPTPEDVPLVIEHIENPRWSYAASKTLGEIATIANIKQYGLNAKIFRVHNIYGPRMGLDHVIPDLVQNFILGKFEVHGPEETRAFMYVDDLISILINFIFDKFEDQNIVYNIGSTHEIKIENLALIIMKLLGLETQPIKLPSLQGSVKRRVPDTTLLKKRFNGAETLLTDGLKNYIQWFRS